MTYFHSNIWWDDIHKQDGRTGFIASLSIHALLFFIGGAIFVKAAQYNVQVVSQTTTVELVEAIQSPPVIQDMSPPKPIVKPVVVKKQEVVKTRRISSQVMKVQANPNYFQNPPPEYPELAKQMRQEGFVMLAVDVDREGIPIKVEIKQSSGYRLLDQAAVKAVSHWKFQPGSIGNIPVESVVTVPIRFRLEK